jgi:outer membrane protein assembly factor BamE
VVALFEGETLKKVEAPELPSEREFVDSISTTKVRGTPRPLELTEEQRKALPPPRKPETATATATEPATPTGPLREYPPLEAK